MINTPRTQQHDPRKGNRTKTAIWAPLHSAVDKEVDRLEKAAKKE
jgi:hypothetical protein